QARGSRWDSRHCVWKSYVPFSYRPLRQMAYLQRAASDRSTSAAGCVGFLSTIDGGLLADRRYHCDVRTVGDGVDRGEREVVHAARESVAAGGTAGHRVTRRRHAEARACRHAIGTHGELLIGAGARRCCQAAEALAIDAAHAVAGWTCVRTMRDGIGERQVGVVGAAPDRVAGA